MLYNKIYPLIRNILLILGIFSLLLILVVLWDILVNIIGIYSPSNENIYNIIKEEMRAFRSSLIYSLCTLCLIELWNWARNRYFSARFLGCNNNNHFCIKINYYENIIPFEEIYTRLVNDNNDIPVRHRYVTSYDDYLAQCSIISYLNDLNYVVRYEGVGNNIHNENLLAIGSSNPVFNDLKHRYNVIFTNDIVRINNNEYHHGRYFGVLHSYCLIFKYHPDGNIGKAANTWLVVGGVDQYSTRAGAKLVAERNPYLMSKISFWKSLIYLHHYYHVRNIENMVILVCCHDNNPDDCDVAGIWCSAHNGLKQLF